MPTYTISLVESHVVYREATTQVQASSAEEALREARRQYADCELEDWSRIDTDDYCLESLSIEHIDEPTQKHHIHTRKPS